MSLLRDRCPISHTATALLLDQPQALEIALSPLSLALDHISKRPDSESIGRSMIGDGHAAAVGVLVTLMTSFLAAKHESILNEGINKFTSGDVPDPAIVDCHR
jgi:hypothetical protein